MIEKVVVTNAWHEHEGLRLLHPALKPYEQDLLQMNQTATPTSALTPLAWYAEQANMQPASMLAALCQTLPQTTKQFWVASPYHARLVRSTLRLMPDAMLDWSAQNACDVCAVLNPLLAEDGLELHVVGEALLLSCQDVWDVNPEPFAAISGGSLPDRQPEGKDAGKWARLISEMQMLLHQASINTASGLAVHGLWFWGAGENAIAMDKSVLPEVATQHIYLKSVLKSLDKEQNATMIVSDAEHLSMLLQTHATLPKNWLLLGAGLSLQLKGSIMMSCLAKVKRQTWKGIQ